MTRPTAENTPEVHATAVRIARSWRCWDRADENAGTEERILDGAVWAILAAIDAGKIPHITFAKAPHATK